MSMKTFTTCALLIAAVSPAFILSSCTDNSPKGLFKSIMGSVISAAEIANDFNEGKIDEDKAVSKLNDLAEEMAATQAKLKELADKSQNDPELKSELEEAVKSATKEMEAEMSKDELKTLDSAFGGAAMKSPAVKEALEKVFSGLK